MEDIKEKYYVEIYLVKGESVKLADITEIGYDTLGEAMKECVRRLKEDFDDINNSLGDYAQRMLAFLMDETIEDTEPVEPVFTLYRYRPAAYYFHPDHGHMTEEQYKLKKTAH